MNDFIPPKFDFKLQAQSGGARAATLCTPHGEIQTPIFMPVGTQGTVKSLCPIDLENAGSQIILGNTYHLMLRPGEERMKRLGGLHKFMNWQKPILTDSGGFQVFSLAEGSPRGTNVQKGTPKSMVKIDDDGVTFRSYLDGSKHRMTPESSMQIQMTIGADIIMAFDQCPPGKSSRENVRKAMTKTTAWLARCNKAMTREESRLFGIIQGGIYDDLRVEHVQEVTEQNLFGYAIGGLSVGEEKEDMFRALESTTKVMPTDKPRYLMGVGTPLDILEGIRLGVDMFDCVMPTRNARNGTLFTSTGRLSIKRAQYAEDLTPLDAACPCYTCQNFTKAYLRHLYVCDELLFFRLASLHNITFYMDLVKAARAAILANQFDVFYLEKKAAFKN